MKMNINLNKEERSHIINYLIHIDEYVIEKIIEKYDMEFKMNSNEIFEAAREILGLILSEKEIVDIDPAHAKAFKEWVGMQNDDDTLYILDDIYDASDCDDAVFNFYCDLKNAYDVYIAH